MKFKKVLAAAAAALVVVALAGCGSSASNSASNNTAASNASNNAAANTSTASASLNFVTGGSSGTYYAVGGVIAQAVSSNTNVKVTALTGNGSQKNVLELEDNTAQLAFCQSDVMAYAYQGSNLFTEKVTCFSTVAALYDETVQIVTCDPNIKTVADLKGKTVSIGAKGSGVYFNAIDALSAYGLTESDINPTYQSFGDSTDALKNGQIDAAFIVAGAPTTAITELSATKQAYLVGFDEEHVNKLLAASPYYSKSVIKAGTYNGITTDTTTVSVNAVILVRNDVSEDAVYTLTKYIFENLGTLSHAKFSEMSVEKAASVTSVPYHAGAAKYFKEKGITVATK